MESNLPPTEQAGPDDNLHTMSVEALLAAMHRVDEDVQTAVHRAMPALESLIIKLVDRMRQGGRLFYLGAGTSGRLGVVDASECPPTFGVASDRVVGIMAGGDAAIRSAVEGAEDDAVQGAGAECGNLGHVQGFDGQQNGCVRTQNEQQEAP